jgi:hypothetical protein
MVDATTGSRSPPSVLGVTITVAVTVRIAYQ